LEDKLHILQNLVVEDVYISRFFISRNESLLCKSWWSKRM